MTILEFPSVEDADEHGLLALGGDLDVPSLLLAYSQGIFPWPIREDFLAWFSPPKRCLLFTDEYHASQSLLRRIKQRSYTINMNTNFSEVISACRNARRPGQNATWITNDMVKAYEELFQQGFAWSVECYNREDLLVGGIYGVRIKNMWAGESMFHKESDTSKMCLHYLLTKLKTENIPWLDCQTITPHMQACGAREVERKEFLELLRKQLNDEES